MNANAAKSSQPQSRAPQAFTLIELILVMTVLTIAVSITAPRLANFFRGRTLDSEGRRLLALTRQGQSRAVNEGVPMELWIDANQRRFGLEAEPSYEPEDPKALEFTLDTGMEIEPMTMDSTGRPSTYSMNLGTTSTNGVPILSRHPELPRIRFLPDGSITDTSPQVVRITGRDGISMWLAQSRNRLGYELHNRNN